MLHCTKSAVYRCPRGQSIARPSPRMLRDHSTIPASAYGNIVTFWDSAELTGDPLWIYSARRDPQWQRCTLIRPGETRFSTGGALSRQGSFLESFFFRADVFFHADDEIAKSDPIVGKSTQSWSNQRAALISTDLAGRILALGMRCGMY
jgi:hypothetical protein